MNTLEYFRVALWEKIRDKEKCEENKHAKRKPHCESFQKNSLDINLNAQNNDAKIVLYVYNTDTKYVSIQ